MLKDYLNFDNFLEYSWGQLTMGNLLIALGIFVGFIIIFWVFEGILIKKLRQWSERTMTDVDDTLTALVDDIPFYFYGVIALYISWRYLALGNNMADQVIRAVLVIVVVYQAIRILRDLIRYITYKMWARTEEERLHNLTAIQGMMLMVKILLWAAGLLLILANLGINITALVASLGIGGVAIAFALQNILSDLFNSFAIYFDKPFQVGDFIIVGTDMGMVKKIGLKTTRITTLRGEELVLSNTELTSTRIQNFKKLEKRRMLFGFGVVYATSSTKLEKIPGIVEKIIEAEELATLDRVHFKEFGDFSLNFEVVYYVDSADFKNSLNIQQKINFALKRALEKEKIEMAFPTQTVYIKK